MRVFIGGASGFIGSAVARSLKRRGHEVFGSARNAATAERLREAGVEPVRADLSDAGSFGRAAKSADAIIQLASTSDAHSPEYEPRAASAVLAAITGTQKTFILTSGCWVYGGTGDTPVTEETPVRPFSMVTWRPALEQAVLRAPKIRGIVVRPGWVYGRGGGTPGVWVASAKSQRKVVIPGDGRSRWSVVHVDDLAELYALILEKAPAGTIYNGSSGEVLTTGEIGRAIARRHGAELVLWPLDDARKAMGPYADALALDQIVQSPAALALGWKPGAPSLAEDLATGSYG
ncbi:MAG TPA: NAD-dependent epimerase/dehydratase family protein [Myxococcaceae bacterium]|nr:NAD-dependent epimerase/dehydratase family protein [Myxococcaceae bacterium]